MSKNINSFHHFSILKLVHTKKKVKLHSRQKNRWPMAMFLKFAKIAPGLKKSQAQIISGPSGPRPNESSNNSNDKTSSLHHGLDSLIYTSYKTNGFYNLYPNQNMMFKPYPKQHQITIYQSVIFSCFFSHCSSTHLGTSTLHTPTNPVTSSTSALTGIPVTFTWNRHQEVVPRICSGLPQELVREFPCRDDKNHFFYIL